MSTLADSYRDFRARGGLVDLSSMRARLRFTGADRVRYLNGQLTANLAAAAKAGGIVPACVTTAKGKLCADVLATIGAEAIVLDADASVRESLAARLERYIVADDVVLEDVTETGALFHVVGVDAARAQEIAGQPALAVNRFGVPGADLSAPTREALAEAWAKLAAEFPVLSPELLERIRIEHGVPRWGAELDENTFPSEAGLDRTHVDYHKGCYIGQEVISRLRSVGHANRELRGFTAEDPLAAGARLFTADEPARDLGRLTSATHSFGLDRPIALGYLRRGAPEIGLLAASTEAPDAPVPVSLHPLPFVP